MSATVAAIAVAVAAALFIRRLPESIRSRRAAAWPITQGIIETVNVKTVSGQALGELGYSYVAEGERYSGYSILQFANEQDAWEGIDPLKGQSIFVRRMSENPAISVLRDADQNFSFPSRHGNLIRRLVTGHILENIGLSDWEEWTKLAAGSWPVIRGHVESCTISQDRDALSWFLFTHHTAEVRYSYSLAGEYYSGYILRSFFRESAAKKFVDSLKDKGVAVRYSQRSPRISVLRNRDQRELQTTERPS